RMRWDREESPLCKNGKHPKTPENTYVNPASGHSQCRPCRVESSRRRQSEYVYVPCLASPCHASTHRKSDDGTPYLCPKHRENPPSALIKLGIPARVRLLQPRPPRKKSA